MTPPFSGYDRQSLEYLRLLSERYPTIQDVCTEIINLQAILNLPKGTEHFMSDLHGEFEAFFHILNNCSGVIREKVDLVFGRTLPEAERSELCTLIYYPEKKLRRLKREGLVNEDWYRTTLLQMLDVCKETAAKYTRSKVRKALPKEFSYIIDELLHAQPGEGSSQQIYHNKILDTIISIDNADAFICALASLIKRLAVDRLHIVGDIFDRGPRPDSIMELLIRHHAVDVEWGNHDILWMGAASGSEACIATVVKNSVAAGNMAVLENGYGISLRRLAMFAQQVYAPAGPDALLRAISVLMFKLEGQVILRHPEYEMEDRLLLGKIDRERRCVTVEGKEYRMNTIFFPTVDPEDPYALTQEEQEILDGLKQDFHQSGPLRRHMQFLYENGSMYRCYNQNLLFHGCIPLNEDGTLMTVTVDGVPARGRELMDRFEQIARKAYFSPSWDQRKWYYNDSMWYLWCGKRSPLFGRSKMTAFERLFVEDRSAWAEQKNPYYTYCHSEETCRMLLWEFGLMSPHSHIINGHVPVRAAEGESPVKANGKLIVIDGGFCRAYHKATGIAGYTLVYSSHGMRILSHGPFDTTEKAVEENKDIVSHSDPFEPVAARVMVMDTDNGNQISERIFQLTLLLNAYRQGLLVPSRFE